MSEVDAATRELELAGLYQASFAELVGYLATLLGERSSAEDVAQEAGMRLMQWQRENETPLLQPRAFLFRIATNLARDHLRRRVVRQAAEPELQRALDPDLGADVHVAARQELSVVQALVDAMPARPRAVLLLSRVEGLSHKEIAERLGIAPKTVENHLGRALAVLAQHLRESRASNWGV